MQEIQIPFPLKGIPIKPELSGRIKLDETMTQTLAALMGYDGEARRLLTCALGGSLHVVSPSVAGITNKVTTGAAEDITFSDQPTTEVMVMANGNNTGDVWVNIGAVAAIDTGWLLDAGDYLQFTINNMSELNLHVILSGDKIIILRTV